MRVATAQLPKIDDSADKIFTTANAVVVLDGASAFIPVPIAASAYADNLGRRITAHLIERPDAELRSALAEAIKHTAAELDLVPGESPSSTVAILRQHADRIDLLALGDSVIVLPDEVVTDGRMDALDLTPRHRYRSRLSEGTGFDQTHKQLLRELQTQQAEHRNKPGGYWIAEAEPTAADHAITTSRPASATPWAILATDGAYNTMSHLGLTDWPQTASRASHELAEILQQCQAWERDDDPYGQELPRAKRHDDKALAAVQLNAPTE